MTQNSVSFSCQSKQSKQGSRCCINFPHELTCQILTNQSIKTVFPACNSWVSFRVRGQFEIKILIVRHLNTTYFISIKKKLSLSLFIILSPYLKTSNLSADNFKKILDFDGSTSEPAIRSSDTGQRIRYFDSCQLITILMFNMCALSVSLGSETSQNV